MFSYFPCGFPLGKGFSKTVCQREIHKRVTLYSSGSLSQSYRYVGQQFYYTEGDLGRKLLGMRWYDAEVGRFVARDPIGTRSGINLYGYVDSVGKPLYMYAGNNPVNKVDPTGEWTVDPHCGQYQRSLTQAMTLIYNAIDKIECIDLKFSDCLRTINNRLTVHCGGFLCWNPPGGEEKGICAYAWETTGISICKRTFTDPECGSILETVIHELIHQCGALGHRVHEDELNNLVRAVQY